MGEIRTRKRGSSWEYSFEGAKIGGKRKPISKSGFRTKKEALEAGTQAKAEYDNTGSYFSPKEISVSDYMDYWYEHYCLINLRYNTYTEYSGIIKNHIKPKLGHYKLCALTSTIIQEFINSIKLNGYSLNMLKNVKACLSAALNYAVEPMGYIKINPVLYVKNPKYDLQKIKSGGDNFIVTKDIYNKLLNRFPQGSNFAISIMLGYYTGCRIGECFALTFEDIDFNNCEISINKQLSKENGQWFLRPPKTDNSYRKVKVSPTLLSSLKKERSAQLENQLKYGEYYARIYVTKDNRVIESSTHLPYREIQFVSRKENGGLLTSESFKYCARIIHYELAIPEFHYHALRHTHGTILAENGVNPVSVMERLGHATIETTLKHYTFNTPKMQEEAVMVFEKNA